MSYLKISAIWKPNKDKMSCNVSSRRLQGGSICQELLQ